MQLFCVYALMELDLDLGVCTCAPSFMFACIVQGVTCKKGKGTTGLQVPPNLLRRGKEKRRNVPLDRTGQMKDNPSNLKSATGDWQLATGKFQWTRHQSKIEAKHQEQPREKRHATGLDVTPATGHGTSDSEGLIHVERVDTESL